jgi:hypothetical protein
LAFSLVFAETIAIAFQWLFAAFVLLNIFSFSAFYVFIKPKKWRSLVGVISLVCLSRGLYCFAMALQLFREF